MKPKFFEEKKIEKKKFRENFFKNFFFRFSKIFFRRNLSYDEYIMHAIFPDHRSRGSGDIRADTQTDLRIYYIDVYGVLRNHAWLRMF